MRKGSILRKKPLLVNVHGVKVHYDMLTKFT